MRLQDKIVYGVYIILFLLFCFALYFSGAWRAVAGTLPVAGQSASIPTTVTVVE